MPIHLVEANGFADGNDAEPFVVVREALGISSELIRSLFPRIRLQFSTGCLALHDEEFPILMPRVAVHHVSCEEIGAITSQRHLWSGRETFVNGKNEVQDAVPHPAGLALGLASNEAILDQPLNILPGHVLHCRISIAIKTDIQLL